MVFFELGVIAGAVSVVRLIKLALEKFRTQMVYMILGMMAGSIYAIIKTLVMFIIIYNHYGSLSLSDFK